MNCKFFSSCLDSTIQIKILFELKSDSDEISKLKTTAASNEENPYSFKKLCIFIEFVQGNIDINQDFLYICSGSSKIDKKIEFAHLENDKIIKIKINEKQQFNYFLFQAFGFYSIKNLALNKP